MKVLKYLVGATCIPAKAKFLHMGVQGGERFAWFQVGRIKKTETQTLYAREVPLPGGYISLPANAVIVDASLDNYSIPSNNFFTVWALGSPSEQTTRRWIQVFGTGQDMPDDLNYKHIRSQILLDGTRVLHVFEVLPRI